ncbi:MAG: tetratricopeptide repeat protein [Cyanobacteria bacterium P01_G01_bin.19]
MDSSYLIQAIVQCEEAVEEKSNDSETWQEAFTDLGNLLQGMGQFDRAIVWHSLALESEANLGEVYCQLGELHIMEKNWSAALASFEHALEYLPNSAKIYTSLAQINGQLQQKEAEMDAWYKATQINPNLVNNTGYYKLAKALERKGDLEKALACYQKAAEGEGGIIAAYYDLGEIYQRKRQVEQARAIYEQILSIQPNEARAQYKLGNIYLQKRLFEQAIDCFRQTIKNAPDFPWAYRDLVKTFLILGKWDEAISTCYAILNLVDEYPWVYSHLGNALREKGKLTEAATNFQKTCAYRGWSKCVDSNYFFTLDIFSHRIEVWTEQLRSLMVAADINALEVGFYQGMSACWLLDTILTHDTARLTCIDENYHPKLKENISKTGSEAKVNLLAGNSHELLAGLPPASFDLINLQDRCKLTDHTEKNTELAWQLLKPQGLMIFNYYGWRNPADSKEDPKIGIDRFLNSIKGQWQTTYQSPQTFQLIVRKV